MPPKTRRKNRGRRRNHKGNVPRNMVGFPKNRLVKMRYNDNYVLNALAGGIDSNEFRINSIFDPDLTGVGHQPLGHDEWSTFYNHYVVVGAKITATFLATEIGTPAGMRAVGIFIAPDSASIPTNVIDLIENGQSRWKYISPVGQSGQSRGTVTNTFSAKNFFSVANISDNTNRIGATFGSNPTELANLSVWYGNTGTADPVTINVNVVIEFAVLVSEPRVLLRS